ncbi:MAG: hypothetical protein PHT13_15305, partial [Methanosarcina sp.]|nr:hypothetical protein [Methanosarcina sp.]
LAAIFYHSEVWEWNEQKIGMKFQLLPGNWQERTMRYYRSSLDSENEGTLINEFSESGAKVEQGQEKEELQESLQEESLQEESLQEESLQEDSVQKIEQTKLSVFFNF